MKKSYVFMKRNGKLVYVTFPEKLFSDFITIEESETKVWCCVWYDFWTRYAKTWVTL